MEIKKCTQCGEEKPLASFYFRADCNKHRSDCKDCLIARKKARYQDKKEEIKAKQRKYNRRTNEARVAQAREYRKTGIPAASCRRSQARHPEKRRTRRATELLIKKGLISKLPCVFCGDNKSQAHHPDYEDQWTVAWLCCRCHALMHRAIRENFKGDYGKSIRDIENQRL